MTSFFDHILFYMEEDSATVKHLSCDIFPQKTLKENYFSEKKYPNF